MATDKSLVFSAALRGFHVYRSTWQPAEHETLTCSHEIENAFGIFAIKICQYGTGVPVDYIPMEISRVAKFLLDRGGNVINLNPLLQKSSRLRRDRNFM